MQVKLSKYHSCENSFLITNYQNNIDYSSLALNYCGKYQSDGLVVFKCDPIEMLFFNKDGSEASMCGNGIRCLMHYLYDKYRIYNSLKIKTKAGYYDCEIIGKDPFTSSVYLGIGIEREDIVKKEIIIDDKKFIVTAFHLGVLHAMVLSENISKDKLYIEKIFNYELFNKEANINIVTPLSKNTFEILTYERGVGVTSACGTGVAASAYVLHTQYEMENDLIALTPGGILKVIINDEIILTGESYFVDEYEESI